MGSLIAGVLDGLGPVRGLVGLAGDNTPYVPSAPVEIGTPGPHHGVAEAGSWQGLIIMFGLVIVIGAAVLMYAVRQRTRLLERRRVRRMAEGPASALARIAQIAPAAKLTRATHAPHVVHAPHPVRTVAAPPRTTPATPGRPAPNA
ncbi:hypothetical protein [Catenulispora rubra]|uniref:hypothetical protein n=1 Tax=Catenulispora rubra TaxID=280293 RepID=UPI0018921896|nr:hypothetical protein [Catenulispora rubra]